MTVSEYIFDFLQKKGLEVVFMVSGSSAMWLTDALKRNEKLKAVCNQHEQASVMAADIYGRLNGIPGVALVTIGPGAMNAITGVAQAYTDSSALFVISGQASSKLLKYEQETGIRQHGTQSLELEKIISPITKYFAAVMQPEKIRYHWEKTFPLSSPHRMPLKKATLSFYAWTLPVGKTAMLTCPTFFRHWTAFHPSLQTVNTVF